MHKLHGDVLLGFGDFFSDVRMGAQPGTGPAPGKPVTPAKYPKSQKKQGVESHGKVMKAGKTQLAKAHGMIAKAKQALSPAPGAAPAKAAVVRAAAVPPARMAAAHTAAQQMARAPAPSRMMARVGYWEPGLRKVGHMVYVGAAQVAQAGAAHARAVQTQKQKTQLLTQHISKAQSSAADLAKKLVAQKKLAKAMRNPRGGAGRTHVGAAVHAAKEAAAVLGMDVEIGQLLRQYEIGFDANGNPPGSPDYDLSTEDGLGDGSGGGDMGGITDSPIGNQIDSGDTTLPAPVDMSTQFADMAAVGGVAYDGSKGYPDGMAGSFMLFNRGTDRNIAAQTGDIDGNEHHGYVFGQYDWKDPRLSGFGRDSGGANKQPGGGIPWGSSLHSGMWNWVHGRHILGSEDWHTDVIDPTAMFASPWQPGTPGDAAHAANMAYGQSFGPLVGNPAMPDFANMRVDSHGNFFWLPQEAPDWLTFPLKQAAALTAQAAAKAAADAAAANQAAIDKINADAAVAAAQQAAQQTAAESAAASQATQAQSQAQVDQAQIETQAQAALVAQQSAETEALRALTVQAQGAPPDQGYYDQGAYDQGGYDDEGGGYDDSGEPLPYEDGALPMPGEEGSGGEGAYDDMSPVPGGDMMLDESGEGFSE